MVLATRRRTRGAWALLAVATLGAVFEATNLWRAVRINEGVGARRPIPDAAGLPATLRFAQAFEMAPESPDAALNRYRALQPDPLLGMAARFNSANLLVREATRIRATSQPGQAIALLELAKEYEREVLRANPADWDARYNLERIQRLLPDPEEEDPTPAPPGGKRERAVTTMRGYSPGLP